MVSQRTKSTPKASKEEEIRDTPATCAAASSLPEMRPQILVRLKSVTCLGAIAKCFETAYKACSIFFFFHKTRARHRQPLPNTLLSPRFKFSQSRKNLPPYILVPENKKLQPIRQRKS